MKNRLILTIVFTILFISTVSAANTVFDAPGSEVSGDTLTVDLQAHESGWATLALPINGQVPISQITDECDIQDNTAYGFEGQGTSTETINGMRGYAIRLNSDCTAQIETSSISGSLETSLPNNGWTVFSVPREMSVSELESNCDFNGYDGTNIFEITLDEGNIPLDSGDTLEGTGLYWIRVQGGDCGLDLSNQPFETPGDGDTSNDGDSSNDGSDGSSGQHEHTLGDLYFWSTDAGRALVNTEAGDGYDGQNVEHSMDGQDIEGVFTWKNNNRVEHTLWVKNENTGETQQTTSSSIYIKVPPSDNGETFGTSQYRDFYEMSDSGCTDYTAAVLPPNWDGSDSDVSSDAEQMNRFTFCPSSDQDNSDDSSNDGSDDSSDSDTVDPSEVEWTLNPAPYEWQSYGDNEVHIEVTARSGGGDLTDYRIWADLNHDAWVNDPNPWTYVCNEGGSEKWTTCHADHTHDPYPSEWETYEITGKLQEENCETRTRTTRGGSYDYEDCSWNTIDQLTWNSFPYSEDEWDGWY